MIIAIDFDGTCVTHEFPKIGESIGAEEVLKELIAAGHSLILFTMRSDIENPKSEDMHPIGGKFLTEALEWFRERNIPLYGVQTNPKQAGWTKSPKAYAHLYIDDAALGCPLVLNEKSERPYVDWHRVRQMLSEAGLIKAALAAERGE